VSSGGGKPRRIKSRGLNSVPIFYGEGKNGGTGYGEEKINGEI